MFEAKVLADSISCGTRLTTLQVTLPRIVLAEFNTHRVFSRNSASSRAIPVEKRIEAITNDTFIPEAFHMNKKGMQAGDRFEKEANRAACAEWMWARDEAIARAEALAKIGVHKQWANRLTEPYSWHTIIVTATDWDNFFALRCNPMAQPEIRTAAEMMRDAMARCTPTERKPGAGEWHLPLVFEDDAGDLDEAGIAQAVKLSVARCARVSYLTHDGKRDVEADLALYDRLQTSGHTSPFEHAAQAASYMYQAPFSPHYTRVGTEWVEGDWYCGNFRAPWIQYRKMMPNEAVFKETT